MSFFPPFSPGFQSVFHRFSTGSPPVLHRFSTGFPPGLHWFSMGFHQVSIVFPSFSNVFPSSSRRFSSIFVALSLFYFMGFYRDFYCRFHHGFYLGFYQGLYWISGLGEKLNRKDTTALLDYRRTFVFRLKFDIYLYTFVCIRSLAAHTLARAQGHTLRFSSTQERNKRYSLYNAGYCGTTVALNGSGGPLID